MIKLSMDQQTLQAARSDLVLNALIAWQKPIYQVLCLVPAHKRRRTGSVMSLGDVLKNAMEVSN